MHGQLAREFARTESRLHHADDLKQTVEAVLELAMATLGCRHAGLMLCHGTTHLEAVGATDLLAEQADRLQLELGDAPCLRTFAALAMVRIDDASTDQRWPLWDSRIASLGLRSVLSTRLGTADSAVGALNLYDESPNRFIDEAALAELVGRHAACALITQIHPSI
jgi:GAF domain-containing protein